MTLNALLRVTARHLPRTTPLLFKTAGRAAAARFATTTIPHLAGHPGPTSTTSTTTKNQQQQNNPSEEARKAAGLLRKLQQDPAYLKKIHDDQPMYFKPEGPDSLPGDRNFKRTGGLNTEPPKDQ